MDWRFFCAPVLSRCGHNHITMKAYPSASRATRTEKIIVRIAPGNPNHHLWNNNGTWWMHYTVHHDNHTKERKRIPLRTSSIKEARKRRDAMLRAARRNRILHESIAAQATHPPRRCSLRQNSTQELFDSASAPLRLAPHSLGSTKQTGSKHSHYDSLEIKETQVVHNATLTQLLP